MTHEEKARDILVGHYMETAYEKEIVLKKIAEALAEAEKNGYEKGREEGIKNLEKEIAEIKNKGVKQTILHEFNGLQYGGESRMSYGDHF